MFLNKKLRDLLADKNASELIKGSSVSFINRVIGLIIAYVFSLVVARKLGAETWGVYSLCFAVVTLLSIISRMGYDTALMRFNAELKAKKEFGLIKGYNRITFLVVFLVSLLLTGVFYLISDLIAEVIFDKPKFGEYFRIVSFAILPVTFTTLNSRALRGLKKIAKATFLEYVPAYLYFLIIIGVLLILNVNVSINHFLWLFVGVTYLRFFQGMYWHEKEMTPYKADQFRKNHFGKITKVALPLLLASSMLYFKGWLDTLMIGVFMTESDVGVYNIVLKLANIISLPITAINTIAAPKFAENLHDKFELQDIVTSSTRFIFYTTVPILILLIVFSDQILMLFGSEFATANQVLIVIAIGGFINAISGSAGYFLQMTGSHVAYQNITIISSILTFVLNLILIPAMGLMGAALTSLSIQLIWNGAMVIYIKKKFKITTYYFPVITKLKK